MIRAPKPEDAAADQFHQRLERQIRYWFHPEGASRDPAGSKLQSRTCPCEKGDMTSMFPV